MMEAFANWYCKCNPGVFQSTGRYGEKKAYEAEIHCFLETGAFILCIHNAQRASLGSVDAVFRILLP